MAFISHKGLVLYYKRRAKNVKKQYEIITDEGTLIKGVIYGINEDRIKENILDKYDIDKVLISFDKTKNRLEIAAWVLEKISENLKKDGYKCFLIEEYPTADRLEVEKIPLPI